MAENSLFSQTADEVHAFQQTCYTGHIVRSGLQPIRQVFRHCRQPRIAPAAALYKRLARPSAKQYARSLRPVQSFMTRHGYEIRTQALKIYLQHAGTLGCVDNKRNFPRLAQLRYSLHRQNISKNVGHIVYNCQFRTRFQSFIESVHRRVFVKQRRCSYAHLSIYCIKRAEHRIMLIARDNHSVILMRQCFYCDIQSMGGIHCEHHPFGLGHSKKFRRHISAFIGFFRRCHRCTVAASSRACKFTYSAIHGSAYIFRFYQRSGSVIEIYHSSTSTLPPGRSRYTLP